jgi:hypothetical protein
MKSDKLTKLEKLVRGSLVASNYIDKNIKEGREFKDLEHLDSIVDWMVEESGFDDVAVFEAMEDYYNEMLSENNSKSLLQGILLKEQKHRLKI